MAITRGAQRERDSFLISLCGNQIPLNPREWTLGETNFLLGELGTEGNAALTPTQLNLVRTRGYNWAKDPSVNTPYPEAALRLDAYARLNEIGKYSDKKR